MRTKQVYLELGEQIDQLQIAFDELYQMRQDLLEIVQRGIKDGEPGYYRTIHKIKERLESVD